MKKLIFTLVMLATAAGANTAFAWPWQGRFNRVYVPAQQAYVVPAPAVAPQLQDQGHRAYSYQPGPAVMMQTYRPAPRTPAGFGDATRKVTGRY